MSRRNHRHGYRRRGLVTLFLLRQLPRSNRFLQTLGRPFRRAERERAAATRAKLPSQTRGLNPRYGQLPGPARHTVRPTYCWEWSSLAVLHRRGRGSASSPTPTDELGH